MVFPRAARRGGILFTLIVLTLLSAIPLLGVVFFLGSGFTDQVAHTDEILRCRTIAHAAYATVLAKIRNQPFSQRFFAGRPFFRTDIALLGGIYTVYVTDTPAPHVNQVDLYVQATYRRVSRLFFWRFENDSSILNASGRMLPVIFANLSPAQLPASPELSPFGERIDALITERTSKAVAAQEKANKLVNTTSIQTVAGILGIQTTGGFPEETTPPPPPPPPPPISTTPPPSAGVGQIITDFRGDYTVDCADEPLEIRGDLNNIIIRGTCTKLIIRGGANYVSVDRLSGVVFEGDRNRVRFFEGTPGRPIIVDRGWYNDVWRP